MKFGICSEIFEPWNDLDRTFEYVKQVGYDGIEIAPYTLAPYVTDIPAATRQRIVKRSEQTGLEVLGLHWLLVGPEGMHLTTADAEVRARTAEYLKEVTRFCGDIGGKLLIFGSPKQRNVEDGLTYDQAFANAAEVFEKVLPTCEEQGCTICMEPLSTRETNFCANAADTVRLIEHINHPNFRLLLDTKAMTDEPEGRPATIKRYAHLLAHYHANDENLNGPGFGDVDFAPIFEALQEIKFQDYVSVEVFKFEPGPEAIATKSMEYMKRFV